VTCKYSEINQHDALYMVARRYPGGIEALAHRTGRSTSMMYNKLRPGVLTHMVSFEEATEVIELCQQAGVEDALLPAEALAWRLGRVLVDVPQENTNSNEELTQLVCKAVKEFGDVGSSIYQSLATNNEIDTRELAAFEVEFKEAIAALFQLRERVQQSVKRGDER
jgi:hypothetical protein